VTVRQLWRFSHIIPRSDVPGVRPFDLQVQRSVSIWPDGRVVDQLSRSSDDGSTIIRPLREPMLRFPDEITYIGDGAVLDEELAAYLRYHGWSEHLSRMPEVDSCPVDGSPACQSLAWARQHVADCLRQNPLAPSMSLLPGEVDEKGRVVNQRAWHVVTICEEQGVDWRRSAVVRIAWTTYPYHAIWSVPPFPNPKIPSVPPPQPEPTIRTPRVVRERLAVLVADGLIFMAERLPSPDVRRRIREQAGLSQEQMAERIECSLRAFRYYEAGERTPEGEVLTRWIEVLQELAEGGATQDEDQEAGVPEANGEAHPELVEALAAHTRAADDRAVAS
jgi:transcriptional regulator with XRE-family HTH domain